MKITGIEITRKSRKMSKEELQEHQRGITRTHEE